MNQASSQPGGEAPAEHGSHGQGRTFRHGVHPPEGKHLSSHKAIERMPFVPEYVIPLSQHIGAPSKAIVKVGQRVQRGQALSEPRGFVSVAHHAPVTGTVSAIEKRQLPNGKMGDAVVIKTDPYDAQRIEGMEPVDPTALDPKEVAGRIQRAGLVGLGGAAFPTHVKVSVPPDKEVRHVVINGVECEPYLTCDHRVMLEHPEKVLRGTAILMAHVGAEKGTIGIELNKPDAIATLKRLAPPNIEVVGLTVKYPQGAEKQLIQAIFGKQVPNGGLPLDLKIVVNNVGTAAALADLFDEGKPLVERVVTVTGPAVHEPKNLLVPIGTPVRALLEHCGGLKPSVRQIVMGGPMMGMALKSLDVPVQKGTSGVLCLERGSVEGLQEYPCIRCGRCVDACPMFLNPQRLAQLARAERVEALEDNHLMACFECASCSFVCPSNIPLVQWMRMGKGMIRNAKKKAAA